MPSQPVTTKCIYLANRPKIAVAILIALCVALSAPGSRADDLQFFKNYFVTGDYAVAGVGLYGQGVNGWATGTINMTAVPQGADIVAAYLYWQTVETTAAPSSFNGYFDKQAIVGAVLGNPQTPSCWSSGGTAPQTSVRVYRADVLRYLAIDSLNNIRLVNGAHTVTLADSGGNGNGQPPHTAGASLVVIYRLLTLGTPLKAVVIYDGDASLAKKTAAFTETISGFYQAMGGDGMMTQIVGDGQPDFSATLSVNGAPVTSKAFVGALGSRWDNYTFPISNYLKPNDSLIQTQVVTSGNQVCLSWGAIVTSMSVVNSDKDGLLDIWKTSKTLTDPNGQALPDLADMGAKHGQKDVFIQMDWMQGADGHLHVPKLAALTMVANAFSAHGIYLHFDVGNNYQQNPPLPYIVPWPPAQGGHIIPESELLCPNAYIQQANCAFVEPYAVLSWKKGFLAVKNGFPKLSITSIFSHTRKDEFHEILMGHAMAGPFDATGKALTPNPSSVSGVADRPGGDLMITLGLWRTDNPANCVPDDPTGVNPNICTDQTGTVLVQAGTIMHELGHNLGLSHGGLFRVPNCMPDYPSVMNYLYQTRGLTDAQGFENVDYSSGLLPGLNENLLTETPFPPTPKYRTRYYGPATNLGPGQTPAKAHCDGTSIPLGGEQAVRLETSSPSAAPDWDNNGTIDAASVSADINFNGFMGDAVKDSVDPTLAAGAVGKRWFVDSNDWGNLNLLQVGARLNVNGLSADVGQSDLGQSDLGQSDLGQSDLGQSDLGQSDLGQSDLGQSDLGDVDYDTAISTLDATSSSNPLAATDLIDRITLNWGLPSIGQIRIFTIYRSNAATPGVAPIIAGTPLTGAPPATTFSDVVNDTNPTHSGAACPPTSTCYNTTYNYFLTATDVNNTTSGRSNTTSGIVEHLWVTAPTESIVYGTPIPASAFQPSSSGMVPPPPAFLTSQVICANTTGPVPPKAVGTYTVHCSGPPTEDGAGGIDGVTYIDGTLTITPRPLTITAQPNTKVFDGNTSAKAIPVVSGLVGTDSVTGLAETYDTPAVGTGKTLSVSAYTINDGNGGKNYTVVTVANHTGVITNRGE